MKSEIEVIITLYKTPNKQLKNLYNYKNFKTRIFEQEGGLYKKKKINLFLGKKFNYYFSKKNIGLSKSTNFLLKKVKSKYVLFTQADVKIDERDILQLRKIFDEDKKIIIVSPSIKKNISKFKNKKFHYVKNINAACILCDVKKLRKIKFFDEDFFLYWEDIDLIKRINSSNYKMVVANNIFIKHLGNNSSIMNFKTLYIRNVNFVYGEFLYDYKHKNLRLVKIFRKLFVGFFLIFVYFFKLNYKESYLNLFRFIGSIKFLFFFIKKGFKNFYIKVS